LIVAVLLYTGMRVGIEALRIKWTDVDFEEAVITVAQSKTAAGLRALPMTEFVASELQKWHSATNGISEYVFFNPHRSSTHIHSVKTAWHNALNLAGIPPFPIYQCRHTFATRLSGLGVSDTIIDQLLGHARRGVLRFYTARVPEYLRDAINLLAKLRTAKAGHSDMPAIGGIGELGEKGPALIN
jgi:integrase